VLEPYDNNIPTNLRKQYEAFGWKIHIPVSPKALTHERDAEHAEVYGIAKGGMLQRNLPKLWHTRIESYLPAHLFERVFHQRWDSDDGYSQQDWIDYINLLMQNKQPLKMWHEDTPHLRLKHMCTDWCIRHWEYKLLPHDDIDFVLDLIEWKEPKVILGEVVVNATEEEPPKKKVEGGGVHLLAFGSYDDRCVELGRVYNDDIGGYATTPTGLEFGYKNLADLKKILKMVAENWKKLSDSDIGLAGFTPHASEPLAVVLSWVKASGYTITVELRAHVTGDRQLDPYGAKIIANQLKAQMSAYAEKGLDKVITQGKKRPNGYARPVNITLGADMSMPAKGGTSLASQAVAQKSKGAGWSRESHLWWDAWCDKLSSRSDFTHAPASRTKTTVTRIDTELGLIFYEVEFVFTPKVIYKTMYKLRPTGGRDRDMVYTKSQSWLTPKENTIKSSYKYYLKTVAIEEDKKVAGLNVERKDAAALEAQSAAAASSAARGDATTNTTTTGEKRIRAIVLEGGK
jgi:hypothetical protein